MEGHSAGFIRLHLFLTSSDTKQHKKKLNQKFFFVFCDLILVKFFPLMIGPWALEFWFRHKKKT